MRLFARARARCFTHTGPLFTTSLKVQFLLGTNDDGTKYKCKMPPLGAPNFLERLRVVFCI